MAAVQKLNAILVSPPGEAVIDGGYSVDDIVAGDPILIDSVPSASRAYDQRVKLATGTECNGFALKDAKAGGYCEYARVGEIDGFIDLTPANSMTIVDGKLDDTQDVGRPQIRVINSSRIYFNVV